LGAIIQDAFSPVLTSKLLHITIVSIYMEASITDIASFRRDLRVLEREIARSLASETGCCGVTLAQCHLLLEVAQRGETGVTELSGILDLDKSTLSRTVEGLVQAGLLHRETDPGNRRRQIVSLTDKGKRKADSINGLCDASYRKLFSALPEGKRAMVAESVSLLGAAMHRMRKECCP
jgi:DNA-binding MarR family transcriptional regulator